MKSTLTTPIVTIAPTPAEEYVQLLLDYVDQLPTKWRWYDLVDMSYRDRCWLEHLRIPDSPDERLVEAFHDYRTVAGLNLIDNLLANLQYSVDLSRAIIPKRTGLSSVDGELKDLFQQLTDLTGTSASSQSSAFQGIISTLETYQEAIHECHCRCKKFVESVLRPSRRRLLNQAFINGVPKSFSEQFEQIASGEVDPEIMHALALRKKLCIEDLRSDHPYIKDLISKVVDYSVQEYNAMPNAEKLVDQLHNLVPSAVQALYEAM